MKYYHTQENRGEQLEKPILCSKDDAWLGEAYYFWENEDDANFWGVKFKNKTGRFDIYTLFMEKSFELIKTEGTVSLILPHKFLISDFGEGIRKFFWENKAVQSILHFGSEMVFADEPTANLDRTNSLAFTEVLKTLKSLEKTIVIATHDPLFESLDFVDEVINIENGEIL